jgi:hypothetical protein
MLARKTSRNRLALPKETVENFPGINFFNATIEENRIVLTPVKVVPVSGSLNGVRAKMKELRIAQKDVAEAVQCARKS